MNRIEKKLKKNYNFCSNWEIKMKKDWIQAGNKKTIPENGQINQNDKMEKMRT